MKLIIATVAVFFYMTCYSQTVFLTYDAFGNRLKKDLISLFPTPVITGPSGPVCKGQTIQLNATGGTDYVWFNRQTTSSISVVADSSRTYSVTAYNIMGCSAVAYYRLSVGACNVYNRVTTTTDSELVELAPENQVNAWSLYPNPTSNGTTVRISVPQPENVVVTIYDELGRKLANRTASGKSAYSIPLEKSLFPTSGIYLIQLSCNGKQSIRKLWVTY